MDRFGIQDIISFQYDRPLIWYRNQIVILTSHLDGLRSIAGVPFAIDAFAVAYITSGECVAEINGNTYTLKVGNIFILSPTHTCRLISPSSDFCLRTLVLDNSMSSAGTYLTYLTKSERWTHSYFNPGIQPSASEFELMNKCLDRIEEQIQRTDSANHDSMVHLAVDWHNIELDSIMKKHFEEWKNTGQKPSRSNSIAQELLLHIINNYRTQHMVSFYAEKMCLTPQYLNQISGKALGATVSSIISSLLYSTARSMIISTDMSIQEIASELSFADQASFSKFFKKMSGNSPASLRKKQPDSI